MSTIVGANGTVTTTGGATSASAGGEASIRVDGQAGTEGGASVTGQGENIDLGQGEDSLAATETAGNDSLTGGQGNDSVAPAEGDETDEQLIARMNEAGGIYADPIYQPFAVQFERQGDLTSEQRAAAAAAFGVPQSLVDTFVDNQVALRDLQPVALEVAAKPYWDVVGGKEEFAKFGKWGRDGGLTQQEQDDYKQALQSSPAGAIAMLKGFNERYKEATKVPFDATESAGGEGPSGSSKPTPFASLDEQTKAMQDPRYQSDEAYRAEVARRMSVSNYSK